MAEYVSITDALNNINISTENTYASAYLSTPTPTTTTLANTYYPIQGVFTNNLKGFSVGTTGIVCDFTENKRLKALLSVSVQSDTSTTTVTITVTKGGVVQTGYEASRLLKLTSDVGAWIVPVDFNCTSPDELILEVKSDKAGAVLTFNTCISNVFPVTHITE